MPQLFSRRSALALVLGAMTAPAVAAEHPAIAYMRQAAKDLFYANRQGTVASFRQAIQRHADVADIADYSLGQYSKKLPSSQRSRYYGGVATFMARYFADQSREFRVAKYELGEAVADGRPLVVSRVRVTEPESLIDSIRRLPEPGYGSRETFYGLSSADPSSCRPERFSSAGVYAGRVCHPRHVGVRVHVGVAPLPGPE